MSQQRKYILILLLFNNSQNFLLYFISLEKYNYKISLKVYINDFFILSLFLQNPFGVNSEFENYFNELDHVCTSNDNYGTCELFKNMDVDESVKLSMQQIFTTLKRSISQKNIYLRDTSSLKYDSCMYYKYWFYLKLIKDNTGKINISRIKRAWQRKQNIIYPFPHEPCRFHANTMEDIKILKVLQDYIFFSNSARNTYNLISDIQKCEYCKHLKNYLEKTFKKFPIECAHSSSNAFCMDYNVHFKQIINLDELSSLSCENDEILSQCPLYSNIKKQASEDRTSEIGEGEKKYQTFQEIMYKLVIIFILTEAIQRIKM